MVKFFHGHACVSLQNARFRHNCDSPRMASRKAGAGTAPRPIDLDYDGQPCKFARGEQVDLCGPGGNSLLDGECMSDDDAEGEKVDAAKALMAVASKVCQDFSQYFQNK